MEVKKSIIPLWQRIIATIIDKVIILLLFLLFSFVLMTYTMPGKLGTFVGLANVRYKDMMSNYLLEDSIDDYFEVIIFFSIFNLLYYILCELFLKASLGKVVFNCRICRGDGKDINWLDVLKRAGVLALLIVAAVGLQIGLNGNIYVSFFLFFALLDIMVFTKQQSAVDRSTDTYVVKKYAEYFIDNPNHQ